MWVEDTPHCPFSPYGGETEVFTSPVRHKELARIKSVSCRGISLMFWGLKLHNLKNVQQCNTLFAFSKANTWVWNTAYHKYSSKNIHGFNWEWNFLMIWKIFQILKLGETRIFLFLLLLFLLCPLSFFFFSFSSYFHFLSFYRNNLPKSLRIPIMLLWLKFPSPLEQETHCWRWVACCKVIQEGVTANLWGPTL